MVTPPATSVVVLDSADDAEHRVATLIVTGAAPTGAAIIRAAATSEIAQANVKS